MSAAFAHIPANPLCMYTASALHSRRDPHRAMRRLHHTFHGRRSCYHESTFCKANLSICPVLPERDPSSDQRCKQHRPRNHPTFPALRTLPCATRTQKVVTGCRQKSRDAQSNMCYNVNCQRRASAYDAARHRRKPSTGSTSG